MKKYCTVVRLIVHTQMKILRRRYEMALFGLSNIYDDTTAPYCLNISNDYNWDQETVKSSPKINV